MKKIFLTLMLIVPAFLANAQGPIKQWNDQLDEFIIVFNNVDSSLDKLNSEKGLNTYTFTYFEPESGNVVKETTVYDKNGLDLVDDQMLSSAKNTALKHLANSARSNSRINSIVNEFDKRNTNIVILYTSPDSSAVKRILIAPTEIISAQ